MDFDLIFSYTRKQAIEDGVLVDVSKDAANAGYKIQVAITSAVYTGYIETSLPGQDEKGRLWDVLIMLQLNARNSDSDTILFDVLFQMTEDRIEPVQLKAVIGPGDTHDPVLTIMLPTED